MFKGMWLMACAGALAQAQDPVTRALGGMRGTVLGRASAEVAKNGEGSSIRLKSGAILHAMSRHMRPKDASKYDNADLWPAVIARTESRDGGLTWTEPSVMFRSTTGENAMQPSFARMANGEIGVSYSRIDSLSAATKVFRYSADEGQTWSSEILISPTGQYWTSAHDRMLVTSKGRVLLTLHHKKVVRPEHMVTQVARSDDHGRTWTLAARQVDVADAIPAYSARDGARHKQGFWEGSIVERADGSLLMIGRTYGGWLYQTESRDQGESWSRPAPTTLMSSAAPGRVERIPGTDHLLVVWNSCCLNPEDGLLGQRLTLSAAISTDGGKTWQWRRDVESVTQGNRVEYPAMNIWDGNVHLTYRAQARSGSQLQMQEYLSILPISWFYAERDRHRPGAALGPGRESSR
jgi:sialidase-1